MRKLACAAALTLLACEAAPPPPEVPTFAGPLPGELDAQPEPLRIVIDPSLLVQVEAARGLKLGQPLDVRDVSQAELSQVLQDLAASELPRDFLDHEGELLRALEAIPASTDWKRLLLGQLTGVVEGLWLAKSDRLFLVRGTQTDLDALIRHELVHALQDRHFDLDGLLAFLPEESDRQVARLHLVEGDAVETVRRVGIPKRETPTPAPHPPSDPPPMYLNLTLNSPYLAGRDFVRALHDAGGNAAVDRAFAEPPESTEQVLHVDKYLAREKPVKVLLPNLPREGAVWEHVDTFGELALGNLFTLWTGFQIGRGVASGWGGDRVALGKTSKGTVVTLVVAMDSKDLADRITIALAETFPNGCRDRPKYGALAFAQKDELLGFFAGPYVDGETMPTCAEAQRELALVLRGTQLQR